MQRGGQRVCIDFTEENLIKNKKNNIQIIQEGRLAKPNKREHAEESNVIRIPISSLIFTFKGKILSRNVKVCCSEIQIIPYTCSSPVVLCYNCVKFGHSQRFSRGKPSCPHVLLKNAKIPSLNVSIVK